MMEMVKSTAEYMAEIDALRREVVALQHERDELIAERDRWKQHATGGHPWPCARFCESKAYQLKIRELEADLVVAEKGRRRLRIAMALARGLGVPDEAYKVLDDGLKNECKKDDEK